MLSDLEKIKAAAPEEVEIVEHPLKGKTGGLYIDNNIVINSGLTDTEKICVLAEEIGHHQTSYGCIINAAKLESYKQELRARRWAVKYLISPADFLRAERAGVSGKAELADFLNVTEEFLSMTVGFFYKEYGDSLDLEGYIIYFDPLYVVPRTSYTHSVDGVTAIADIDTLSDEALREIQDFKRYVNGNKHKDWD
ncbi:MAG: ImmA/IrrE family metallo-endopeptidase [Eubacteriaceae bacterium]|jgi:hypothetical protein|nr:ImmA/IrrE family metallo-endopeptidase [Eubacteriaceae bacterium]